MFKILKWNNTTIKVNGAVWSNLITLFNPSIVWKKSFGVNNPLTEKPSGWFEQAETENCPVL